MKIEFGRGETDEGPGVLITLDGNELCQAISTYLMAHDVTCYGARTIRVNRSLCQEATVYVDPSGRVMNNGTRHTGRGKIEY